MAITNAQQYKQLVNKPANGERPGYRGDAAYRSQSLQATSIGQSKPGKSAGTKEDFGDTFDRESFQRARDIGQARRTLEILKEDKEEEKVERFRNKPFEPLPFPGVTSFLNPLFKKGMTVNRNFFLDKVLGAGRLNYQGKTLTPEEFANLSLSEQEAAYKDYMSGRLEGRTDAYGNPIDFDRDRDDRPLMATNVNPFEDDTEEDTTTPVRNLGGLTARIGGGLFNFDKFAADGGRIGAQEGGPVGGIMDLESGRQMYFLGKLVKKATRAVKKIAKSPIGKAAILGGLAYFGGGGGLPKFLGGKGLGGFSMETLFSKANPLLFTDDKLSLGKLALASAATPFLFPGEKKDEFDLDAYYAANQLDPSLSIKGMGSDFDYDFYGARTQAVADGGRIGYQEGGDAEPVAKKTMPLLDMGGKEKDYRETGGFVDMGRMERADDVPARLSKNEFVFTADAVRNAGEGDIDKGAEVMYNMMKNLEAGGEVSEESQGLEGARKMFQTSQRLGEVI